MGGGFFGEPGTYGETDNRRIFGHMRQTIERLSNNVELLTLEIHISNMQKEFEKGNCTFAELDRCIDLSKKLIDSRTLKKIEEAIEEKKK